MIKASEILDLFEAITMKDIDKLEKEAGAFSKNILRIKNGKDLAQVYQASIKWQNYFEDFVYRKLLGVQSYDYKLDSDEPWYAEDLRKEAWELYLSISSIFSVARSIYDPEIKDWFDTGNLMNGDRKGGVVYKGNERQWEMVFDEWKKDRKKNYSKFGILKRKAFKALRQYMEYDEAGGVDRFVTKQFKVNGIPFVTHSKENDTSQERVIERHKKTFGNALKLIAKKGLSKVTKGLRVNIDLQSKPSRMVGLSNYNSDLIGGYYSQDNDELMLLALATNTETLIHEIGHRYYYKFLKGVQRKHWDDFVENNSVVISDEEFDDFKKAMFVWYDAFKDEEYLPISGVWDDVESYISSDSMKEKYRLVRKHDMGVMGVFDKETPKKTLEAYFKFFKDSLKDKKIMLDTISDYGNTNPQEAWAELFVNYVMGKNVPDLPLSLFKKIILGVL